MEQISVNKHGGAFRVGKYYSFEKKVSVMETFHELQRGNLTVKPTISSVAKASKVSWDYAKKVMLEIEEHGTIIPPINLHNRKKVTRGVGALIKLNNDQAAKTIKSNNSKNDKTKPKASPKPAPLS